MYAWVLSLGQLHGKSYVALYGFAWITSILTRRLPGLGSPAWACIHPRLHVRVGPCAGGLGEELGVESQGGSGWVKYRLKDSLSHAQGDSWRMISTQACVCVLSGARLMFEKTKIGRLLMLDDKIMMVVLCS